MREYAIPREGGINHEKIIDTSIYGRTSACPDFCRLCGANTITHTFTHTYTYPYANTIALTYANANTFAITNSTRSLESSHIPTQEFVFCSTDISFCGESQATVQRTAGRPVSWWA